MIKDRKKGRTPIYSINEESPLVQRLEDFDNSLIESMIGAEEFTKIRTKRKQPVRMHYTHSLQRFPVLQAPRHGTLKMRSVTQALRGKNR